VSKKALMVATVGRFFGFEKNDIEILKSMGYEVHCAANFTMGELDGIPELLVVRHHIDFSRSPYSPLMMKAYRQLCTLLEKEHFDLLHCHTPVAAALARMAARKYRKRGLKVIYTSHGFHFHKSSSFKDWLIYYPIEYLTAYVTDLIITINREDYALVQKFPVKKKRYIPGVGVDVAAIASMERGGVDKAEVRRKYSIPEAGFLLLSIGELSDRKNHEVIIRAIAKISCDTIYYIICGAGQKENALKTLAKQLGVEKQVIFAGYCSHEEILKLCHTCDLGALPSKIEGLGLAGIETLAAGKPLVASKVHGIKDYVIDDKTGIGCQPTSVEQFSQAIERIRTDKDLYEAMCKNAQKMAEKFDMKIVDEKMRKIYKEV
jgi:glycosyltransferase involved in cell wall biosynthesis